MDWIDSSVFRRNPRSWDDNFRAIDFVYRCFEELGLATLAASRIRSYQVAFERFKVLASQKGFLKLPEAIAIFRTVGELTVLESIVRAATESGMSNGWPERLRELAAGTMSVLDEGNNASPRDLQFEAWIAAVAQLSGYGFRFAEPDVVVTLDGEEFGFAAKRPRSENKIISLYRKGAKQIVKSKLPGLVAFDITYLRLPDKCVHSPSEEDAARFAQREANSFLEQYALKFRELKPSTDVLGVVATLHCPALIFDQPEVPRLISTKRWTIAPLCGVDDPRFGWVMKFARAVERGLFGVADGR